MQTLSAISRIVFVISITALSSHGLQSAHAQESNAYVRTASKSTFDNLFGDHYEMVLLVTGDDNCAKSYDEANELKKLLTRRNPVIPVVNVVIVNRLIDSVAFRGSVPIFV